MKTLGFGQPANGLVQLAYIVPDIHAAIDRWTNDMKAGPWFSRENSSGEVIYRGQPSEVRVNFAMGFAGHVQIELIEPLGEAPSVFREVALKRGYGFHHYGVASVDVEADTAQFVQRGYSVVFQGLVPTGGTVVYLEAPNDPSGFIELIPATEGLDAMFTHMWRCSCDWDGRDPVRPFTSALEAAGLSM